MEKGTIKLAPKALEVATRSIKITPRKEAKVGRLMVEAWREISVKEKTKQKNKEIKYDLAHKDHKPTVENKAE